jgi:hypothetical protein
MNDDPPSFPTTFELSHRKRRVTMRLAPGQTLADFWARYPSGSWWEGAEDETEVVIVGDALAGTPLQDLPLLRERAARGQLVLRTYEAQDDAEAEELRARYALTAEEAKALEEARRREPRVRPAHPAAAELPWPPSNPHGLPPAASGWRRWFERWRQPRHSPLSGHVGPRLPPQRLTGEAEWGLELAARVRAWPLPGLVGQVLVAPGVDGIPGALRALLHETFGDVPFGTDEGTSYGGLGVHLHLHTTLAAPPSEGEPMALELYGQLLAVGEHDLGSPSGARLMIQRSREYERLDPLVDAAARARHEQLVLGADLPAPLYIILRSATYANVLFPGDGVPFYG